MSVSQGTTARGRAGRPTRIASQQPPKVVTFVRNRATGLSFIGLAAAVAAVLGGCSTADSPCGSLGFAGKAVNASTGEWPSNRLVLAYLKGREVGRGVTTSREFEPTGLPIVDGVFVVEVPNQYELTAGELSRESGLLFRWENADRVTGDSPWNKSIAYHWFGDVEEGSIHHVGVPSRNITYTLKVVQGDLASLPGELQVAGSTELRGTNTIVVSSPATAPGDVMPDASARMRDVATGLSSERVVLSRVTIPIDNCGGNALVSQTYVQSQTFIHSYRIEAGAAIGVEIPVALQLRLVAELEARYSYEQGQLDTRSIEYSMAAEPRTSVTYVVTWSEVWESGTADVETGPDVVSVPFRVRTNVVYDVDSETLACE